MDTCCVGVTFPAANLVLSEARCLISALVTFLSGKTFFCCYSRAHRPDSSMRAKCSELGPGRSLGWRLLATRTSSTASGLKSS